ncbi:MAG TPA: hypothetical protein VMW83_01420 [Spirochaetia bacterium]|nr:hypothetical protein [Spirochaetia bacterium]
MSLVTTMESWCHNFKNTTSEIATIVKHVEKYSHTVVRHYTICRHKLNRELRAKLKAQRLDIEKKVTNMLDSYARDRSAASAILAEMRNNWKA